MGQRPDLDLSDILPAYQEFISGRGTSTAGVNRIRATPEGDVWEPQEVGDESAIPDWLYSDWFGDDSTPRRVGNGPATCSTSQVVALRRPLFAWDVNGWYRTIGVPFPYVNATQGVLSRSYVASGGQRSARATYYLKRLLDRAVRPLYDAMPLGHQFLDDEYVQEALKAAASAEAGRRSADGFYTKPESVMDEWGYKIEESDDTGVDSQKKAVLNGAAPEGDSHFEPIEWVYSYWLWRTRARLVDSAPLEQWQTLLVSSLARRKQQVNLAVGRSGKSDHPYTVGKFDGVWVVFLHEDQQPTQDLADRAANALMLQLATD